MYTKIWTFWNLYVSWTSLFFLGLHFDLHHWRIWSLELGLGPLRFGYDCTQVDEPY